MTNLAIINKAIRALKKLFFLALIGITTQANAIEPNIGIIPNAIDKEVEAMFEAFNEKCISTAGLTKLRASGFVYGVRLDSDAELRMQCVPHPLMRTHNKNIKLTLNLTTATKVNGCREDSRVCSVKTEFKQGKSVTHYLFHTGDDDLYIAGVIVAPNIKMDGSDTAYYTLVSKKCYQRSDKQTASDVVGLIGGVLVCLSDQSIGAGNCTQVSGSAVKETSFNLLGDLNNQCLNM